MRRWGLWKAGLSTTLAVALCIGAGMAQAPPPPGMDQAQQEQGQAPDPPGRVARLEYMSGQVSLQPGGVDEWIDAAQNDPLTSADRIWTDKDSRSELSLGTAAIRMSSETSLTLTNVADQSVQLQVDQGTLSLTVFRLFPGEIYEVDTPNFAFTIMKPGEYRFDVMHDADRSQVTVRRGSGEATGEGNAVRVNNGERTVFWAGASLTHTADAAPSRDAFDDWARVRNQREGNSVSARYVAPGVIGYEDLDTYGTWRMVPTYGWVWYPYPTAITAGWAPYRDGHWAWVEPWGWTWVDNAAWGFAPYHYGRWVFWGGAWAWCPGPVSYARPVYAPALVGWVGGPRFGVGLSFGAGLGVGWFPLGWGEPFIPAYHVGVGYFRAVNVSNTRITNVTVINNIYVNRTQVTNITYVNRNVGGAVTATSTTSFAAGHSVATAGVVVPPAALRNAEVIRTAQVVPVKASVLGGHAPVTHGVPPPKTFSRTVITHQAPPPKPVSFEAKQAALSKNNGMPLDHATLNNLRTQQPTMHGQTGSANVNTGSGSMRTVPRPPVSGFQGGVGGAGNSGSNPGATVPRPPNSVNSSKTQGTGTAASTMPEPKRPPTTTLNQPKGSNPPKGKKKGARGRGSLTVESSKGSLYATCVQRRWSVAELRDAELRFQVSEFQGCKVSQSHDELET